MAHLPLALFLTGAIFLALTLLFLLEAHLVLPANRRDDAAPDQALALSRGGEAGVAGQRGAHRAAGPLSARAGRRDPNAV